MIISIQNNTSMRKKYIYILILFLSIVVSGQSQIILTNPPKIIDLGTIEKDIYKDYELRYVTGSPGSVEFTFKLATTTNIFFRIDKVGYLGGASISTLSGTPATYVRSADDPNYKGVLTDPNYKECEYTCYANSTYKYLVYGMSPEQIAKIKIKGGQYIGGATNTENSSMNYILTLIPQKEVSSINYTDGTVDNYVDNNILMSINYFDGLGRPVQSVQRGITPDKMDLVSIQEYDAFGRESNAWLPGRVSKVNNGAFVPLETAKGYIKTSNGNDQKPYSISTYEASPLSRVLKQFGPGQEWQNNGKSLTTDYLTNSGTTGVLSCIQYTSSSDINTTIFKSGNYTAGELYVTRLTDEDGNISYEFKDKLGKVILERQIENNINHDTYYIYDNFGNLKMVLPPIASDMVNIDPGQLSTGSYVRINLAYIYQYDSRNRCIGKKLPGCEWIYYVYDKADQLIFTQDGEQRLKSEWAYSIPDVFGRIVLTGTCKNTINYDVDNPISAVVKAIYNTSRTNLVNSYIITGITLSTSTILSANYYDDYSFLGMTEVPNNTNTQYVEETGYGICYGDHQAGNKTKNKGLLTGTVTTQMNSTGGIESSYLYSVMYYDNRERLIQSKSNNHLPGGIEMEYVAYNFTGQPIQKKHVHSATGKNTQTEVYTYTYDHAGRLLTTTHQLTDGTTVRPQVTLADNTYDELGRLKSNQKGGLASSKTTYGYNIRSWTKSITSPLFTQTLYYNDTYGGSTKQYNGNVGAMNWQVNDGGSLLGYTFSYDNLSRLTSAVYLVNGAVSTAHTDYKTSYSYDKHGNMKTLTRGGAITATTNGLIDNLTMTYTGNQLTKVDDAVGTISLAESMDFKNYSNVATEYTYNANGAMTKDLNKGITEIQYNPLNLPRQMDIKSPVAEARNEYTYSAGGQKLKVVQKWNPNYSTTPVIGSAINTTALTQSKTIDYVGNKIYENGTLKRILIDGGYIEGNVYHYYLTDHLGNNRVVVNASGTLVQKNHYYPFGSIFAGTTGPDKQSYKYNGKELDLMHGLNLYDYSARYYESSIGRFTSVDPLAEMYYNISPYAYVANSPIKHIDEEGKWINNVIGGIFGAAVEYGSQVAVNVAKNGFNSDAFTKNIDLVDIGVAAIEGAITSGASVAKNVVKKAAITATAEVIKNTIDGGTDGSGKVSAKINDAKSVIKNTAIGLTTDVITKGIVPKGKINGNVTTTSKTKVANALKNAGVDGKKASAMSKKITPIVNKAGNKVRREANELSQKSVSSGVSTTIKSNLDDEKN